MCIRDSDWFNEQYLRAMQPQDFADLIKPLIDQVLGSQDYNLALLAALLQPRITRLSDIPEQIDFFVAADPLNLDLYRQKRSKLQPEVALIILTDLIPKLSPVSYTHLDVYKRQELVWKMLSKKLTRIWLPIKQCAE